MSKETCSECDLYKYASEIVKYGLDTLATFSIEEISAQNELEERNNYYLGFYHSILSRLLDIEQSFQEDTEQYTIAKQMKEEIKKSLEKKLAKVFQLEDKMIDYINEVQNQTQERLDVATDFITQADNHCIGMQ